jgi:hypothetical protein
VSIGKISLVLNSGLMSVRVLALHRHDAIASKVGYLLPLIWLLRAVMSAREKKIDA